MVLPSTVICAPESPSMPCGLPLNTERVTPPRSNSGE
jgi:hypothetical protein